MLSLKADMLKKHVIAIGALFAIATLASICCDQLLESYTKRAQKRTRGICVNNLYTIESAKYRCVRLAGEGEPVVLTVEQVMAQLEDVNKVVCPLGTNDANISFADCYGIGSVTSPPTCRIAPPEAKHRL